MYLARRLDVAQKDDTYDGVYQWCFPREVRGWGMEDHGRMHGGVENGGEKHDSIGEGKTAGCSKRWYKAKSDVCAYHHRCGAKLRILQCLSVRKRMFIFTNCPKTHAGAAACFSLTPSTLFSFSLVDSFPIAISPILKAHRKVLEPDCLIWHQRPWHWQGITQKLSSQYFIDMTLSNTSISGEDTFQLKQNA